MRNDRKIPEFRQPIYHVDFQYFKERSELTELDATPNYILFDNQLQEIVYATSFFPNDLFGEPFFRSS